MRAAGRQPDDGARRMVGGSMRTPSWPTALLIAALPSRSAAHGALHDRTAKTARALGGIKHGRGRQQGGT